MNDHQHDQDSRDDDLRAGLTRLGAYARTHHDPAADAMRRARSMRSRRRATTVVAGVAAIAVALPFGLNVLNPRPDHTRVDPATATPTPTTSARPSTSPSVSPSVDASSRACDPLNLSASDALPDATSHLLTGARQVNFWPLALGASGEILQETAQANTYDEDKELTRLHQGTLSLLDPKTGKTELVRAKKDRRDGMETGAAVFDDNYVVWEEDPGMYSASTDWRLYVRDRRSGKVSEIARTQFPDNSWPQVASSTVTPTIDGGWVYWTEARPDPQEGAEDASVWNIYGRPLDLSQPTKLIVSKPASIRPSGELVATQGWLYYLTSRAYQGKVEYSVHRRSVATGETTLVQRVGGIDGNTILGGIAAYGDTVSWIVGRDIEHANPGSTVYIYSGTQRIAQIEAPDQQLYIPSVGPTAVGFGDNGDKVQHSYVFDLRTSCLHDLGKTHTSREVLIAGTTIMWTTAPKATMIWHRATLR